jgi:hypothetical protein
MLWVWLYRICPQVIDTMVLVKPVTVVQWHHKGFRLYWRWRSRRPGRPKIGTEECGRNLKNAGYVLKAARANAVGALLVFLHLLESDATDEIAAFNHRSSRRLCRRISLNEIVGTRNKSSDAIPSA